MRQEKRGPGNLLGCSLRSAEAFGKDAAVLKLLALERSSTIELMEPFRNRPPAAVEFDQGEAVVAAGAGGIFFHVDGYDGRCRRDRKHVDAWFGRRARAANKVVKILNRAAQERLSADNALHAGFGVERFDYLLGGPGLKPFDVFGSRFNDGVLFAHGNRFFIRHGHASRGFVPSFESMKEG